MQGYISLHNEKVAAKASGHDPATHPEITVQLLYGHHYGTSFRILMSADEARALAAELVGAADQVDAEAAVLS